MQFLKDGVQTVVSVIFDAKRGIKYLRCAMLRDCTECTFYCMIFKTVLRREVSRRPVPDALG